MKITKPFLAEVLDETINEFSKKVTILNNGVTIEYIEKDEFMNDVKENPLIQQQIQYGFYKNIDKEYPNFLVVYARNKHPLMSLMGVPYKISICLEMAKDILKPFDKKDVKAYLLHVYSHEIAHIIEEDLIKEKNDLWNDCLQKTNNNQKLAMELFVESVADMISDKNAYIKIHDEIWSNVKYRMEKVQKSRNF